MDTQTVLKDRISKIVGEENLSTSFVDLAICSRDLWLPYFFNIVDRKLWKLPDIVVWPETTEQISEIVKLANEIKVPVITLGGGAGVCGGISPTRGGIIIDMKKMNKIIEINDKSLTVRTQTGIIGMELEEELNKQGYTLGHYPLSIYSSTIGGFLACRSAGVLSNKYGKIEDMVLGIQVVLPTGEIIETKPVPRSATGPNLTQLFVGSEGTLGIITEATLRIHELPEERIYLSYRLKNVHEGLEAIRKIFRSGVRPAIVRLYDEYDTKLTLRSLGLPAEGCLLILSFEGNSKLVKAEKEITENICEKEFKAENLGEKPAKHWWIHRHDQYWMLPSLLMGKMIVDTMEVAATWDKLEKLYFEIRKVFDKHRVVAMAHFSHSYQEGGSIYFTFLKSKERGKPIDQTYWDIWKDAMETCLKIGGTISHHHGIGLLKGAWLPKYYGNAYKVLANIKRILDPNNILNPGKLGFGGMDEARKIF